MQEVIGQLRLFALRSVSPRLVQSGAVIKMIENQSWNQKKLREEANPYTDTLCNRCRSVSAFSSTGSMIFVVWLEVLDCSMIFIHSLWDDFGRDLWIKIHGEDNDDDEKPDDAPQRKAVGLDTMYIPPQVRR